MSFLKYPDTGNNKDRNEVIDNPNELEGYEKPLNAEDHNSLIDSWVDLFSWYPSLWGPNSDAAKDAIKNTLNNVVNHKNALQDALDMLDKNNDNNNDSNNNDNDIIPPDTDTKNSNDSDLPPDYPTPPAPRDPLALDADKDGFISNIALEDSHAYFDITGDGIREKVGWIDANDALLVYDKNENGHIDGVDEVFGSGTINGFEELKQIADSNYDDKIDRRDELFSRLQVWNDLDGDARVDTGELSSLSDNDIKSIDLNYVSTNIDVDAGNISEASKYTDADGNKELVADVNLETDTRLTTVDFTDIPGFTIDPVTLTLPNLKGYGLFIDTFKANNINEDLKNKAIEISSSAEALTNGFDEYVEIWSGYTEYIESVKEKYGIDTDISMTEVDKKTWIIERLVNQQTQTSAIEDRLVA